METSAIFPTFDIECVGWTLPIAVGFYDGVTYREFMRENENDNVIARFLDYLEINCKGIKLYAHCASKYDNKFILSELCKRGEQVSLEAGLVRLKWKRPDISFEDSYPLLPFSLKASNKMFGTEDKLEWEHELNLKPWEMGENLGNFKEYLKRDCLSLSHTLHGLCTILGETFGVVPSITLPTTATKAFDKCFYTLYKVDNNEEYEEFIRKAIYGGRNEIYKRYGENINHYDVRSMFVSCYDIPVPTGRMRWVPPNIDEGTIAEATVSIPKDLYIGPLPVRRKDRLIFPVGEIKDWWDTRELRNASKIKGVDIKIRRQLKADELPILRDFGTFVGKLRQGEQSDFWKMFGLALSGKLGQSRWRDSIKHINDIRGHMTGFTPIDKEEIYFQTKEYVKGNAPYIKPAIAMRVRAEARIRHLNLLMDALNQGKDIFYCDTDSIFTTAEMPVGNNIGDLVWLGKAERGYFIKQKLYAVIEKGRMKQRSAGYSDLKLREEDFQALLRGEEVKAMSLTLPTYKEILKLEELQMMEKSRPLISETRMDSREAISEIDTKPIELQLGE